MRELFDPADFRLRPRRTLFVRRVERPLLVLGSTQSALVIDADALRRADVEVVHRRSGGGAVLLEPSHAVWMDTWIPRADPLWDEDVRSSGLWVGSWWTAALQSDDVAVHTGPQIASPWSEVICFAGVAAGEVTYCERKLVGVAQWRGREGALTSSLAYVGVDWRLITVLLGISPVSAHDLELSTATVSELALDAPRLTAALVESLPPGAPWDTELS